MSVEAILLVYALQGHPAIEPVPGSKLTMERGAGKSESMVVVYREDNRRRRRTVRGSHWYFEYDLPDDVTRDAIVDHFAAESERLHATIRRRAGNRLTFSFLREDGGETWCQLWATDGNYTLEIVDEAPPESEAFDDAPQPHARVVFPRGEASIDEEAERVLDAVADWLEAHPSVSVEIRGHRGPLEDPAIVGARGKAVFEALVRRGIAAERLQLGESDRTEPGFEVTIDAGPH